MLLIVMHRSSRRAFTLVEVLVTFMVLVVSIAIFAPVLLKVRDNTQANVCRSRMRHLALGVQVFEGLKRGLPAGAYVNDERASMPVCDNVGTDSTFGVQSVNTGCFDIFGRQGGPNYGWIVNVLPFIDREDLYEEFDFSVRAQDQHLAGNQNRSNRGIPVVARQIPTLLCPTDGGPKLNYDGTGAVAQGFLPAGEQGGFAKTNYVGFMSVTHIDHFGNREGALGGFEVGNPVGKRISQLPDGQNNTLLLSEVRALNRSGDSRGAWSLAFPGATLVAADIHSAGPSSAPFLIPSLDDGKDFPAEYVALPNSPTFNDVVVGTHSEKVELPTIGFYSGGGFLAAAPRSQHPGGVHASSIGGHVGLLSNSVDPVVYAYLIHTRDGQKTEVGDYLDSSP